MTQQVMSGEAVKPQTTVGLEMRKMAAEPLLPIEKKLIGWSLGLGLVLLVVLVFLARIFVPGTA